MKIVAKLILSFSIVLIATMGLAQVVTSSLPVAKYQSGEWSEWDALGNHRARINVETKSDAVAVRIPWRRRDSEPDKKAIIVCNSNNERVTNAVTVLVNHDEGRIIFQPSSGAGDYFIYYMPYKRVGTFESETYTKPKASATTEWLNCNNLNNIKNISEAYAQLPKAKVIAIESRGDFNSFFPMEVCATIAEVAEMKANLSASAPFYTFPEPRERDIRMRYRLPYQWVQHGPQTEFTGKANPNEYFPFQIGIWAGNGEIRELDVEFENLVNANGDKIMADRLTCFNTKGVNYLGEAFVKKLTVPNNDVQALWIGAAIPEDATGTYTGKVFIHSARGSVPVEITINVSGDKIPLHGDKNLESLSRLRWLNSCIGIRDKVLPGFEAIKVAENRMFLAHRQIEYQSNSLPAAITSNNIEILAAPIILSASLGSRKYNLSDACSEIKKQQKTFVEQYATAKLKDLNVNIKSTLEQDGCLQYEIILKSAKSVTLDNLELSIPFKSEAATYIVGMGKRGGYRRENVNWKWGELNLTNQVWLGNVKAGMQLKLQEDKDIWTMWGNPVQPNAWYNEGRGGCTIEEKKNTVLVNAYCGQTRITPEKPVLLRFRLLITPFKKIDNKHWDWRTSHFTQTTGSKIRNMFHREPMIPYINYPFTHHEQMLKYFEQEKYSKYIAELIYPLTDKFSLKSGAIHIKTVLNFNPRDRRPHDDRYGYCLADLFLNADTHLGIHWSTDDIGIRTFLQKRVDGKWQAPLSLLSGKNINITPGDDLNMSLSWGENLNLYINGKLAASTPWRQYIGGIQLNNPILKLTDTRFIISKLKIDDREFKGGIVNFDSNADTILQDNFSAERTLTLPVSGTIKLNAMIDFDPTVSEKRNPAYNRVLLQLTFGEQGRMILYWNVDDNGMRLVVQKGNRSSKEYPIQISTSSPNWRKGQTHDISLTWGKNIVMNINGEEMGKSSAGDLLANFLNNPAELKVVYDGFKVNSWQISSDDPTYEGLEFSTVYNEVSNMSKGGGYFIYDYALGWNGLQLINRKDPTQFQIYYTLHCLSNHAREIWAFKSLGNEIYSTDKGGVYFDDIAYVCGKGGGYPWLMEHLIDDYIPAWRTCQLGEDFCASLSTNSNSRLVNHYLKGLNYLTSNYPITGLYLDGIGYGREVMKRIANVMAETVGKDYKIETHCSDIYRKFNHSVINHNLEHLPYVTKLWYGEGFDYNSSPDFYLVEISGIPFGLTGEMLDYKTGGNPWRGMIYGMGGRFLPACKYLWDFWDKAKLNETEMIGYWDKQCPVKTNNSEILTTIFNKAKDPVIAVAHWPRKNHTAINNIEANFPLLNNEKLQEYGARLTELQPINSGHVPISPTVLYAAATPTGLKFHFQVFNKKNDNAKGNERDARIWQDDSVEIFIRPNLNSDIYYQFVGNNIGTIYDSKQKDKNWNGDWKYNTRKTSYGWSGDLFISYTSLQMNPLIAGNKIGFNFARNCKLGTFVWKNMEGNFHQPEKLAIITINKYATRQNIINLDISQQNNFKLDIDFKSLNLDPKKTKIIAPAIYGLQSYRKFNIDDSIPIEAAGGWLFILKEE